MSKAVVDELRDQMNVAWRMSFFKTYASTLRKRAAQISDDVGSAALKFEALESSDEAMRLWIKNRQRISEVLR